MKTEIQKIKDLEISVGQIWKVNTENFLASKDKKYFNRHLKIDKDEYIEIRYPYAWHFRTEDNNYFHASEEDIIKNCEPVGVIWEKVQWNNIAKLNEIINLKLYEKI